jgi:hypothetical protein
MKKLQLTFVFLITVTLMGISPASFAGSTRLIMNMTTKRMVHEQLIHVRFLGSDGVALESDTLKQMVIRENDCTSGHLFKMETDYEMGYEPDKKLVGIYLNPNTWKNKSLCFNVPGLGKVERIFTEKDNDGHSIQLNVAP